MKSVGGVLLDVDGVLVQSWRPLPGAVEAVAGLRRRGMPFRLVTNTTQFGRDRLAKMLRDGGFDVEAGDVFSASVATGLHLRSHHPGASCYLLADEGAKTDLEGVAFVDDGAAAADVVVIGDADEAFNYGNLNRAFRMLMDGAALVAMQRNLYWRTDDGLALDAGAFVATLEAASGVVATVIGKPSAGIFDSAIESMGVPADRVLMAGDDVVNDVLAAQAAGLTGVLVRTGKYRPADEERLASDTTVIDSVADLDGLLE